jgi:hypothetical protein
LQVLLLLALVLMLAVMMMRWWFYDDGSSGYRVQVRGTEMQVQVQVQVWGRCALVETTERRFNFATYLLTCARHGEERLSFRTKEDKELVVQNTCGRARKAGVN